MASSCLSNLQRNSAALLTNFAATVAEEAGGGVEVEDAESQSSSSARAREATTSEKHSCMRIVTSSLTASYVVFLPM
eukprot:CAMPEP_0180439494 /NCGR_PEP_ID=MMETSP1036_2-20121128/12619_1 /TAXON_ID=632150 /ORGANISM="Azadinium spinosum, Strain 3D9" /LENGTH=76 /DNA_ID=CAMNT_0022445639 /DNA_START=1067 /DNA_END=1297 /DNA_ORIENTATION=-